MIIRGTIAPKNPPIMIPGAASNKSLIMLRHRRCPRLYLRLIKPPITPPINAHSRPILNNNVFSILVHPSTINFNFLHDRQGLY
jgi:hypothetical protein